MSTTQQSEPDFQADGFIQMNDEGAYYDETEAAALEQRRRRLRRAALLPGDGIVPR